MNVLELVFVGDNARGLQTIANVLRSVGFEQWDQATPRGQPEYTQEFSRGRATSAPKKMKRESKAPDGYLSSVDDGGWGRRKRFTILKSSASCSNDSMGEKSPFQTQSDRLASSSGPGIGVQLLKKGTSYGDNPNCGASGYRRLGSHLMARAADSFFRGKTRHVRGLAYSSQGQENYDYGITQKHAGSKEGVELNGNVHGEYVQVALLFTPDYSEGVSFHDVRAIHILDAPENLKTYEQIIGRARRTCSHNQLQFPDQYTIRIHMYSMVFSPDAPYSPGDTDESTSGADVTDDQGHCTPHCEWRVNSLPAKKSLSAESCTPNADISSLERCPNTHKLLKSILESSGGNSNAEEATQLTADAAIWLRAISAWQPVYDLRRSIYTVAVDCEANSWRIYGQANGPCGQKQDSESPSFSLPENGESPLACVESLREIVNTRLWEGSSEEEPVAIADSVFAKARDAVAKTSFRCKPTHLHAYLERLVSSLSDEHRIIKEDAREYDDLLKINSDAQRWARVQRLKTLLLKGRDTDFVFSKQTLQIPKNVTLDRNTDTSSGASGAESATSAGSSSSILPGNVKIKTRNQTSDLDPDTFVKAIDLDAEIFDPGPTLEFKSKFVRLYKAHEAAKSDKKLLEAMEKQQRDSDKRKVEEYKQRQNTKRIRDEYARLKDLDREDADYDAAQDLKDLKRLKKHRERIQSSDDEIHDINVREIDNLIIEVQKKKRRASLQNKLKQRSHYRLVVNGSKKAPKSFRITQGDKYATVEQCAESPFLRVACTNVIPPEDASNPNMPYTAKVKLSAYGWDLGEWVVWATVDDSEGGKEKNNLKGEDDSAQTYDDSTSDSDGGVNKTTTVTYHFRVTKNEQEKWTPRDEGMISAKNDRTFLEKLQKPMSGSRRQTIRVSGWTQKSERVRKNLLAGIVGMGLHSLCESGQKCQTITSALREGVRSQVSNNDHRLWCPKNMSAEDMRGLMSIDLRLTPPLHSANTGATEVVSFSELMQAAFVKDCPDNRRRRRKMPNYAESDEESEDDSSENLSRSSSESSGSVPMGDAYQARDLPPADPGYAARERGDVLVHESIRPTF